MSLYKMMLRIAESSYRLAQYGPGYASPWSDVHVELLSLGPIRNPDAENPPDGVRGYMYRDIEGDLIQEWGTDYGNRPGGMITKKKKIKCRYCKGNGCRKCNFTGKKTITKHIPHGNERVEGKMLSQLRYLQDGNTFFDKPGAWPHNRDFNNLSEEPITWTQYLNDRHFFGLPTTF